MSWAFPHLIWARGQGVFRGAGAWTALLVWVMAREAHGGEQAGTVQAWPEAGSYTNGVGVMLWAEKGAIHYTLDGSEPGPFSPPYREPLWLMARLRSPYGLWSSPLVVRGDPPLPPGGASPSNGLEEP